MSRCPKCGTQEVPGYNGCIQCDVRKDNPQEKIRRKVDEIIFEDRKGVKEIVKPDPPLYSNFEKWADVYTITVTLPPFMDITRLREQVPVKSTRDVTLMSFIDRKALEES